MGEQEIELEQENIIITAGGAVNSVNGYTGDVVLTTSDLENTSDYQTGTEVESAISTAIAGKQDTLTAGDNITISNNTISATDTTYTAGTGLDLTGTVFSVDTDTIATKQSVTDEATARENADINLQGQIDAITASSDVKDIVGTHAELEAYDTSTLQNNDIIKVLQDETEDDATTYYRWSTTTETFTLIGEEGPYYTKAATDTLLDAKQDVLTAGANVQISASNVISATDTTYTDFTGTDGTAAGTSGLVPAPATTDAGKFLKADGTWDDAAGSTYTAGDGIDITNAVISATNTGKARELNSADYDFPSNNPTSVALWKLDTGVYKADAGVSLSPNNGSTLGAGYSQLVIINKGAANTKIWVEQSTSGAVSYIQCYQTQSSGLSSGNTVILTKRDVKNTLTSTSTDTPLSANQGKVLKDLVDSIAIRGAGAPTTATVGQVGTLYEDTTNGDLYICTDATNPYVWEAVGGGGSGPTVVQTTGTSTTDVMSQNAVTSMVFADPATQYKIKIGAGTSASEGNDGIEIGHNAAATQTNALAIGVSAEATGARSTAVGQACRVQSTDSVGLGGAIIRTNSTYSVALGNASEVSSNALASIALGAYSKATQQGQMDISTLGATNTIGYNSSNYRLLTGLYDGQSAHDAATVGQITPTTDSSAPTSATAGRLGEIRIDTTTNTAYMCVLSDSTSPAYEWKQITA